MLVIQKNNSKLLPVVALCSVFVMSFIGSASVLYALDPKGEFTHNSSEQRSDESSDTQSHDDPESADDSIDMKGQPRYLSEQSNSNHSHTVSDGTQSYSATSPQGPREEKSSETTTPANTPKAEEDQKPLLDILPIDLPEVQIQFSLLRLFL